MKTSIYVWEPDKPHKLQEGTPMTKLVEQDNCCEVTGLGIEIEGVIVHSDNIWVYLNNYPERIDYDPRFHNLYLLDKQHTEINPEPYSRLASSTSYTIWAIQRNGNNEISEAIPV